MSNDTGLPGWLNAEEPIPDDAGDQYMEFAEIFRHEGGARVEPGTAPHAALSEMGLEVPPGVDLRVWVNTDETFHVVFPPDPNTMLSDESLSAVAGGSTAGTASSIGCAGTASSLPSCAFSVSTAGTAGTAGCGG